MALLYRAAALLGAMALVSAAPLHSSSTAAAPPSCGALEQNTGYPHSAAGPGSSTTFHGDAAACCAKCAKEPKCAAFSWHPQGGNNNHMCALHPAGKPIGAKVKKSGCTSGIVRPGDIPPPTPPPPPQPIKPAPKGAKNVLFIISDDRECCRCCRHSRSCC